MRKVLPLLIFLSGCAGAPSMEAMNIAAPEDSSEPAFWPFSLFGSANEPKQPLPSGERQNFESAQGPNRMPTEELQQRCDFFWPIPVAGCAGDPSIEVTKLDRGENSYELVPRPGWFSFSLSVEEVKQALMTRAQEVCAPGSVGTLDFDRPDYIRVEIAPRGYLHCR